MLAAGQQMPEKVLTAPIAAPAGPEQTAIVAKR